MAITSVTQETVPYIVEDDRASSDKTVFHVRQLNVKDALYITALISQATEERRGKSRLNEQKLFKSFLEHWPKVVAAVDNFKIQPGTVFLNANGVEEDLYQKYRSRAADEDVAENGLVTLNAKTIEELQDVMKMLPIDYRQEVVDFAEKASNIGVQEKN